jgi:hypothetical protein
MPVAPMSRRLFRACPADITSEGFIETGARMRAVVCLLPLVLLAACSDVESGLAPLPNDRVRVRFPPGGVVAAIEVDAVDRLPLRSAELIAPDGEATPAIYLHVDPTPSLSFDQRFVGGGPYTGNAIGASNVASSYVPFPADLSGAPQARAQLLTMFSIASIPLPDEVAYRRDWRSYRIFLSFGDVAGEVERRVLPAPEPPPNA